MLGEFIVVDVGLQCKPTLFCRYLTTGLNRRRRRTTAKREDGNTGRRTEEKDDRQGVQKQVLVEKETLNKPDMC